MAHRVGIIGTGKIAQHLEQRLTVLGWEVVFRTNRREYFSKGGASAWDGSESAADRAERLLSLDTPELVFLAHSTNDEGQEALGYIKTFGGRGIPLVTCEKGALSHFDLREYLPLLGYTASVGGGTHMLRYVSERRPNGAPVDIDGVFNGTLNYVFHQVSGGSTLAGACEEAKELHITEPGADDPLSVINGEMRDVVMKVCVLHNSTLSSGEPLTPAAFGAVKLTPDDLELLAKSAGAYRMIVSLSNSKAVPRTSFFKEGYGTKSGRWDIRFGFRNILNEPEFDWLPGGVGNGICLTEGYLGKGGKYILLGPGAGLEPTTTAMLNDARRLLSRP